MWFALYICFTTIDLMDKSHRMLKLVENLEITLSKLRIFTNKEIGA